MQNLDDLVARARDAIAAAADIAALDAVRVAYLGKKGALTELLKGLGRLAADERPAAGQVDQSGQAVRADGARCASR